MFVSVNWRNNETQAHIAVWARTSLFCRFTDTNVYGTGSDKNMENSSQNICGRTDIFSQCLLTLLTEATSVAGQTFTAVWSDANAAILTRKLADRYTYTQ